MSAKKTTSKKDEDVKTSEKREHYSQKGGVKKFLITLIIFVVTGSAGYFGYLYFETKDDLDQANGQLAQAKKDIERLTNPEEAAKEEVRVLTEKVAMLVDVPKGETPTLATVNDPAKLKEQAFFTDAQGGDKVLVFVQAKRAILYRPSTGKVVQVANVSVTEPAGTTPQQ